MTDNPSYPQRTTGQKLWTFTKWFVPYLSLIIGFTLVIAGMADIGYVPASPTCAEWRQANHEYHTIQEASTSDLPDLLLLRFSNACGLWKTWFTFAILSVLFYAFLIAWPIAFTIGRRFMFVSMEVVAACAVLTSILTFLFVILFFGVGGAWKYKFKCQPGNPPVCAFYSGGQPYPTLPSPDELPWRNTSQAFRDIMVDPKFFARYALDKYGTADTILTCIGAFFGALGAILLTVLEGSKYRKWEKEAISTRAGTPAASRLGSPVFNRYGHTEGEIIPVTPRGPAESSLGHRAVNRSPAPV